MFKLNNTFLQLIPLALLSSVSLGKGLTDLSKSSEGATSANRSEFSDMIRDKLFVSAGFGMATAADSDGNDYRVGGSSDLEVGYKVLDSMFAKGLWATFRYMPLASTIASKKDNITVDYKGTVETYNFGALVYFDVGDKMLVPAQAELGILTSVLQAQSTVTDHPEPDAGGVNLTVSSGLDYELMEKTTVGPRVRVGFGSVTTTHLGVNFGFMF